MSGIITFPGMFGAKKAAGSFAQAASIVALWDFESGATTADSAGSNTLTRVGTPGPTTVTGQIGDGAGGFSGSDYFDAGGHVGPSGTSSKTIFGWFKTSSQIDQLERIISSGDGATTGGAFVLSVEDGQFWVRTGGRVASYGLDNVYNDGNWHSFVAVVPVNANLSDVDIYIDGTEIIGVVTNDGALVLVDNDFFIGSAGSIGFGGDLDQIGIADTAWTVADALDHYGDSGSGQTTDYLLGGPVNLVTNGDFDTGDLTGWIDVNSYYSVVSGKAFHPATNSTFNQLLTDGIPASGQQARIRFEISDYNLVAGVDDADTGVRVSFRDASQAILPGTTGPLYGFNNVNGPIKNGAYNITVTVPADAVYLSFARNKVATQIEYSVDNVIIEQV